MLNINSLSDTDNKFAFTEVQIMESICPILPFYNNTLLTFLGFFCLLLYRGLFGFLFWLAGFFKQMKNPYNENLNSELLFFPVYLTTWINISTGRGKLFSYLLREWSLQSISMPQLISSLQYKGFQQLIRNLTQQWLRRGFLRLSQTHCVQSFKFTFQIRKRKAEPSEGQGSPSANSTTWACCCCFLSCLSSPPKQFSSL